MSRLLVALAVAALTVIAAMTTAGAALGASGDTYVQVAKLTGNSERSTAALVPSSSSFNTLGTSVAVSGNGDVLAVGAPGVSRVYVFVRPSNGAWKDAHETVALFPYASQDNLGTSVAVSSDGKTIVAGAPSDNGTAGAVYVYTEPPGGWRESAGAPTLMLIGDQGVANDELGASVAIDAAGNTIVAGAPGWSGGQGAIYLFTEHPGGWRSGWTGVVPGAGVWANVGESGGNSAYGGDFGQSVAMSASGDTIAVGAPYQDGWEGAVYVFDRSGGQYRGYKQLPDTASGTADDYFICDPNSGYGIGNPELGTSVSISSGGHTIAAGEPCAGTGGQAVVYTEPSHGWLDATGEITAGLTPLRPEVFSIQQDGYAVAISGSADAILADDPTYMATSGGYVGWTLEPSRGWGHVNPPDVADFGSIFNQTQLAGGAYDLTAGDPIAISAYAGTIFVGGTGHDNEGAVYVYNEISRGATPRTVSCSPSAVPVGKSSSCKVTAKDAGGGSRRPTGTVSLSSNGGSSGHLSSKSCTLKQVKGHSGSGDCSFAFTPNSPLAYTITAHYDGDLHHHSGSATAVVSTTRRTHQHHRQLRSADGPGGRRHPVHGDRDGCRRHACDDRLQGRERPADGGGLYTRGRYADVHDRFQRGGDGLLQDRGRIPGERRERSEQRRHHGHGQPPPDAHGRVVYGGHALGVHRDRDRHQFGRDFADRHGHIHSQQGADRGRIVRAGGSERRRRRLDLQRRLRSGDRRADHVHGRLSG